MNGVIQSTHRDDGLPISQKPTPARHPGDGIYIDLILSGVSLPTDVSHKSQPFPRDISSLQSWTLACPEWPDGLDCLALQPTRTPSCCQLSVLEYVAPTGEQSASPE